MSIVNVPCVQVGLATLIIKRDTPLVVVTFTYLEPVSIVLVVEATKHIPFQATTQSAALCFAIPFRSKLCGKSEEEFLFIKRPLYNFVLEVLRNYHNTSRNHAIL